ncbi:MAG: rhamnulokinase family protein [Oscillospiraceae bacterium]
MAKRILIFDLGISRCKTMLCRCENGAFTLEDIHSFDNIPIQEAGHIRWNIDELFTQMKIGMSIGVFNGGYDAISIVAWGVDFGLLDRNGDLLENPVQYGDSRTDGIEDELYGTISAAELFERTGIHPHSSKTIFQLLAQLRQEGSTLFRAESLLMIPDLFAYLLTGEKRSELIGAASTLLIDRITRSWDFRAIDKLGLPRRLFSPIVKSGEQIGFLRQELAQELRIEPVPVLACASLDIASAASAVPCTDSDYVFICCGNRAAIATELDKAIVTDQVSLSGFSNGIGYENKVVLHKDTMGLWLLREARNHYNNFGSDYTYEDLENAARECKPFESLIDPNDPCFTQSGDMPQKIADYCRRTNQRVPESAGETTMCIIGSLACDFALNAAAISDLTAKRYDRLYITGKAAKNALLCELTAQASGKTVIAGVTEPTALGCGITAMIALGEIGSIQQAREMILSSFPTKAYEPDYCANSPLERYIKLTGK